jgi:hypothetical protein
MDLSDDGSEDLNKGGNQMDRTDRTYNHSTSNNSYHKEMPTDNPGTLYRIPYFPGLPNF